MPAYKWIPGVIFAFSIALILMPLLAQSARLWGWVDRPSQRKQHHGAIPLVGGVAMYLAFTAALITLVDSLTPYAGLLAAITLLTAVGIADDIKSLSTRCRFTMQALAAALIILVDGVYLERLGDLLGLGEVKLEYLAIPFTVFCVAGAINAVNMLDGIDGLAGGTALITTLSLILITLLAGHHGPHVLLPGLLAAAIAGFLWYNLRHPWRQRAVVFMGDSGSTMLGLILVWSLMDFSQGEQPLFNPVIALWIFALPLYDTVRVLCQRALSGQNPCHGDRQHLHHLLLAAGFSDCQTTAILLAAAMLLASTGIAGWCWQIPDYVMFYSFMGLFTLYYFCLKQAFFSGADGAEKAAIRRLFSR